MSDRRARFLAGHAFDAVEEQLLRSQKMEAIGRLASGVAHDFNNLLTVITGYTTMVLADTAEDTVRRDLGEVLAAAERAAALTQQILAFSRRQAMTPRIVDLRLVIDQMRPMLERIIGEDIRFTVGGDDAPAYALADRAQVEQVVMNLIVNARDAMPCGGRLAIHVDTVTLTARDRALRPYVVPGEYTRIRVRDTGSGMDERTLAQMFDPFFTTKAPGKGTGLGLATVYDVVKRSRGFVWADSTPGRGTTFSVHLPRVDTEPDAADGDAHRVVAARARPGATVLLVEDEAGVRTMAERVLREQGYEVIAMSDGDEALVAARWHEGPIDLLVTDVVMPTMSGREMVDRLARTRASVPVLFMTGHSMEAVTNHGGLTPGSRLLRKPFTPRELSLAVGDLLAEASR